MQHEKSGLEWEEENVHNTERKRDPEEGVKPNLCRAFLPTIEENILFKCMQCFHQDHKLDLETSLHKDLRVKSYRVYALTTIVLK